MQNKLIIHLMTKSRMKSDAFRADLDAIEDLSERFGITNMIFYKGDQIEYSDLLSKLEKFGIFLKNYANKGDLKDQVQALSKEYEIVYIYTAMELLIKVSNEISKHIGLATTDNPEVFRNKFLQRELIQEHAPELGIKFMKGTPETLSIDEIEQSIGYPFIIKPIDGVQSSGVEKISTRDDYEIYMENYSIFYNRLKARGVDSKGLIVEEFIDGELYTLDYYVNPDGTVVMTKPAQEILGVDIGIDDYCVIARVSSLDVEAALKGKRLKTFISSTVSACGIRNSFVHHEFKLTSQGKLKTIELNGRFGGGRVDLMKRAYGVNVFEMPINPDFKVRKIKENNIVFNIHAPENAILRAFNNKILAGIKRRESVLKIRLEEGFLGKETGFTKDGFVKMGTIKLANKDFKQLMSDFRYIKSRYKHLLLLDPVPEPEIKRRTGLFHKIGKYLAN